MKEIIICKCEDGCRFYKKKEKAIDYNTLYSTLKKRDICLT